jgi:hydrogenase maturation protease
VTAPRILIACIGNIFLGDDAFGVEVARRLAGDSWPEGVVLKDFGIRGFDLTYALLDPWDLVILVDACPRGGDAGEVYLVEPDAIPDAIEEGRGSIDAHGMNPMSVLRTVESMGGPPNRILIVGCEPLDLGSDEEGRMGLSEPVAAAVERAAALVRRLVDEVPGRQPVEALAP